MLKSVGKFEIPYFVYRIENPSLKEQILNNLEKSEGSNSVTDYENVSKTDWYANSNKNYFYKTFIESEGDNYYKILKPYLDEVLRDLEKNDDESTLSVEQGWYVQYKKLNYYNYHDHLGARWAIVYYAELPSDGPKTEFENFFGKPIRVNVNEGDILVFSGWLKHRSPPNISRERKTIIAFNVVEHKK
jgi:hypothetical protein